MEQNPGLLQEHQLLLTIDLSLQSLAMSSGELTDLHGNSGQLIKKKSTGSFPGYGYVYDS